MNFDVIDVDSLTVEELYKVFHKYAKYYVLKSVISFKILGLPTLDCIVVFKYNNNVKKKLTEIFKQKKWDSVLLRRDAIKKGNLKPRGGFIYSIEDIYKEIKSSLLNEYLPILHTPYSRFNNLHSGNILYCRKEHVIYFEIISAGFDLSDLNRGDLNPHEIFKLNSFEYVDDMNNLSPIDVLEHHIISQEEYRMTWKIRMEKIFNMIPKTFHKDCLNKINTSELYLKSINQTLILDYKQKPNLLGYDNLCKLYKNSSIFFSEARKFGFNENLLSLGFGFPKGNNFIFWNVFSKY